MSKYLSTGEELIASNPNSEFWLRVALGEIAGMSFVHKFGMNPVVDTGSNEAIWDGGGLYVGHNPTAEETVEVFSSSAFDDAGNIGAITVQIYGLDADFSEQNETVTLDGTTAVDSSNTYIRLNRAIVRTAGAGGVNVGTITVRQKTTTANIFTVVPATYNQSMVSAWTVPGAKTAYILQWASGLSGKTNANCSVRLKVRPLDEVFQVKEEIAIIGAGSSYVSRKYDIPKLAMAAKTDIVIEADSDTNATGIAASFDLLVIDD